MSPRQLPRALQRATAFAAVLGTVVLALALSATPASATEVGLNVSPNPALLPQIAKLHPAWVRLFLDWNTMETARGSYDTALISGYQSFLAGLPAGTQVDLDVVGTPSWASGGSTSTATPPLNDQDFAGFLNYITNAFGHSVNAYEIWNEEDSSPWWSGTPAQFASLLQAAYPAIKAANPNAVVIMGANNPDFLAELYSDGAGGSFDAVAVHTDRACGTTSPYHFEYYPGTQTLNPVYFLGFATMHSVMASNGDGAKPLYMTELGWATDTGECTSGMWAGQKLAGVTPKKQVKFLKQAYHCLAQPQYSYVVAGMWFSMVDLGTSSDPTDHFGLLTTNLTPKPSFSAFEAETHNGDQLTGPCGNFNGPRLVLISPRPGEHYSGPLPLIVKATGSAGPPPSITLQHDGTTILHFNRVDAHVHGNTLSGRIDWMGARNLSLGSHTITAVAVNAGGVPTTVSVTVVHVPGNGHH